MPQNMYNLLIKDVLVNREKYANAYKSQSYSLSTTTMPRLTGPLNFAVFSQEQHDSDPPSPILTRSGPL